jgi:hypothetical protein
MSSNWPDSQIDGASKGGANDVAPSQRFSDVHSTLKTPVHIEETAEDEAEAVEVYLEKLSDPSWVPCSKKSKPHHVLNVSCSSICKIKQDRLCD